MLRRATWLVWQQGWARQLKNGSQHYLDCWSWEKLWERDRVMIPAPRLRHLQVETTIQVRLPQHLRAVEMVALALHLLHRGCALRHDLQVPSPPKEDVAQDHGRGFVLANPSPVVHDHDHQVVHVAGILVDPDHAREVAPRDNHVLVLAARPHWIVIGGGTVNERKDVDVLKP